MDQHRHHELINSHGERQSAMYFNRGIDDMRPQNQYYSHQESIGNNNARMCASNITSSDITCNACNTGGTEESWKNELPPRVDFYNSNTRNNVGHNPIFIHENRSFYPQRSTNYTSESKGTNKTFVAPQTQRTLPSKTCTLETNCNLKQQHHQIQTQPQHAPNELNVFSLPTQPQQQHMSAMGVYCKDRSYDEKYASRQELYVDIKTGYPTNTPAASYSDAHCNQKGSIETVRNMNMDQNIINPTNVMTPQEQASPIYGRKCPQIFTNEEQNVPHQSLYMSTPQFSSDKFTNLPMQTKSLRESEYQHRELYNPNSGVNMNSEQIKLKEMQISSSVSAFPTHINKLNHMNELPVKPQIAHQEPTSVVGATHSQTKMNYYHPSTKVHGSASDMPSIIVRQPHTQQYSESHISLPPTQSPSHCSMKSGPEFIDFIRKDDNLYTSLYSPYNTPSPLDNCCKEMPKTCTIANTNMEGAPQIYKYGNVKKETNTTNKICIENQNTLPSKSVFKTRAFFHENRDIKYGNNARDSKTSVAGSAQISPSTSHAQVHHNNFTLLPQSYSQYPQPYHQHQTEQPRSAVRLPHDTPTVPQHSMALERQQNNSKMGCLNVSNTQEMNTHCPQFAQKVQSKSSSLPSMKKTPTAKPNYRELINQVYAMRTATSEEELNLQIIKKALNPASTISVSGNLAASATDDFDQRKVLQNTPLESFRVERTPTSTHLIPKAPANTIPEMKRIIKAEEQPISPLDLSMRTIKTKADSTEYRYQSQSKNSQIDYRHTLPRVDFTPNFSLHVENQSLPTKPVIQLQNNQSYSSSHVKSSNDKPQKQTPADFPQRKAYTDESRPIDSAIIPSIVYPSNIKSQCLPSMSSLRHVKNSTNQDNKVSQVRPSVLETNPFATVKSNKCEENVINKIISKADQQTLDNNVTALPKPTVVERDEAPLSGVIKNVDQVPFAHVTYNNTYDRDPKYLGRKRHLQEYSNSQNNEPAVKQTKYADPSIVTKYPSAETAVITVNKRPVETDRLKTAEKSIQAEIPAFCSQNNSIIVANNDNVPICKTEPKTPVFGTPPSQFPTIKTETSTLGSCRIRTKAELKGFTFQPPVENIILPNEIIKVKEEPSNDVSEEIPSIPDVKGEYDSEYLLDKSWNNTCNEFMEQLISNSKRKLNKKKLDYIKTEDSETNLPLSTPPLKNDAIMGTDRYLSNFDSAETSASFDAAETYDSTFTGKSVPQELAPEQLIQKKISKQDREKLRLQQEKRLAARIKDDSSSESNNELQKRKCERPKKMLRKVKDRQRILIENSRFSDCGSDSSSDIEEESVLSKSPVENIEQKQNVLDVDRKAENLEKDMTTQEDCGKSTILTATKSVENYESSKSDEKEQDSNNQESQLYNTLRKNGNKSNEVKSNITKKGNPFIKIGLNTMTRSKRKQEMEIQLANSKVLRNDKIIRNSTTKIKRKYVKKYANNQNSLALCKELSENETDRALSMQLRSKKMGSKNENVSSSNKKKTMKNASANNDAPKTKSKGNETQSDMYLEVYRYKRSLKVPPSLITIDHPHSIKMAESLPHLEQNQGNASLQNKHSKMLKSSDKSQKSSISKKSLEATQSSQQQLSDEPRSIIDVLHSRVLSSSTPLKPKCKKSATNNTSLQLYSETSHNTESNCTTDLLPALKKDVDEESSDGKKRHFSIFETKVLQTKTRTESKLQQRKEIIREIFVGDDRPASAPPEISQMSDGSEKMTFEQKYEQFLQQLNIVINEDKLRKYGNVSQPFSASTSKPASISNPTEAGRQDLFNESLDDGDINEKIIDHNRESQCSIVNLRRRRPGKYLRRKGSSGFDYIRKKKKPSSTMSLINAPQNIQESVKMEKSEEFNEHKLKSESDVCREIQKWVLNKSVGQSTMHKAARLGYIDVVVYCLDRIGMNPDQKDNAGYTPLHEACTKGWLEIARILLQYGANHSEAAHSGIRPLHEAAENDHKEVVRLLLSYGADPLLATYSGQTPLMLASSTAMRDLLNNHLSDVQNVGPDKKPWICKGPWEILEAANCGYDIFGGAPNFTCDMSRALRKSSISNLISNKKQLVSFEETRNCKKNIMEQCAVVLENIDRFNSLRLYNDNNKSEFLVENSDSEGEVFEFEEADVLLPPLYLLKDEGSEKWVLLSDLCNLLKVKSKDTLLNKIYPPSSSASSAHKNVTRELKMSDFLEKATCLQLLCAGEKINICASKVVLIKYNDSVRNLLGVKTIMMKF